MQSARIVLGSACILAMTRCGGTSNRSEYDSGGSSGGDAASQVDAAGAMPDGATHEDGGSDRDASADAQVTEPIDAGSLMEDPNWAWVSMPAGTFEMGGGNAKPPANVPLEIFISDAPKHMVNVSAFDILRAEVTVAQYRLCVRAGVCSLPDRKGEAANWCSPSSGTNNWLVGDRESYPVNCVSPSQAAQFCAWAGGRLPSEAEWEYAARSGGQDRLYPWGNDQPDCSRAVIRYPASCNDVSVACDCGGVSLPVCSKALGHTAQGLCDMAGSMLEPVADDFHSDYTGAPSTSQAWGAFDDLGIMRGGSFMERNEFQLRVTSRSTLQAGQSAVYGIRCAR